jgi:hypothetical protein
MTVQGVESAAAIFTALSFWNSNCCGCFRQWAAPSTSLKNVWPAPSARGLVRMAADRGKGEEAGPEGRDPSAQREHQLQGAGALADPGAHRRRPQGGEREDGVRPSLGLEPAIDDGRGRGDCSADQGGHAAGFAEGWIKRPVGLATLIWTNIGNSGTMGLWRTMESPISEARASFADPLRRAEAGDEVLLPAGGTAKMAQIARPMFSFP